MTGELQADPVSDGGRLRLIEPWHHYRFLLDNGDTLDVHAHHDSSDLRALVVTHTGRSIVGVAEVLPF